MRESPWRLNMVRRRSLVKLLTVQFIATTAASLFLARYGLPAPALFMHSVLSGVPAALTVTVVERVLFPRIYKFPFLFSLALRAMLLGIAVVVGFAFGLWVIAWAVNGWAPADSRAIGFVQTRIRGEDLPTALFVFVALIAYSAIAQLTRWLGPGVLGSLLIGRYHRPRREDRIFMFLDMKNSTALAEQLGDLKFSEMVREFFYDLTPAILESEASVLMFVGDEVILTWSLRRGIHKQRFLRAYFGAKESIARRAPKYCERYGVVPDFKAGVHAGPVVGTEVGDVKTELVYHGDVLNTGARIRSLCTDLEIDLLVSDDLRALVPGLDWQAVGTYQLKGRQQPVSVSSLRSEMPALLPDGAASRGL